MPDQFFQFVASFRRGRSGLATFMIMTHHDECDGKLDQVHCQRGDGDGDAAGCAKNLTKDRNANEGYGRPSHGHGDHGRFAQTAFECKTKN